MKMKRLASIALSACMLLTACGKSEPTLETITGENDTANTPTVVLETEPQETNFSTEGKMRSYLTGEWIDKSIGNRRPVAVMLNNIVDAVPQSGIAQADIVYEAPVEGGLTRLMGIFEDYDSLDKIGSVRSSRLYYVYFAKEFDAIYVHFGQAIYAESLLNSSNIQNLNGLQLEGTAFYRTSDRKAPHNAYTSADGIGKGISLKGYRENYEDGYKGHYVFNEEEQEVTLNGSSAIKVTPGYQINKPWFEYHSDDGLYYRSQYGDKQIDELTKEQLAYKNIIMQYVNYYDYGDGYLNITVNGSGKGKYITNGKAIDITWKKDTEFGPTRYYDENNEEIVLNRGKTWVCIIQNDRVNKIEIE